MSKDKAIFCIEREVDYQEYSEYMIGGETVVTMDEFVQIGKELKLKQLLTGDSDAKTHPS